MILTECWFIPFDILRILCAISTITCTAIFLLIIIVDKRCHTIPMMLIANTCLALFLAASTLLGLSIFALHNDLKQISFQDSLCVFRAYFINALAPAVYYSYFFQALYRYMLVVYPTRSFWQSAKCQLLLIAPTWIFDFLYPLPYTLTNQIIYDANNQMCQLPIRPSFSVFYTALSNYILPVSLTLFIYWKLVRYVKEMSRHVTLGSTLIRARNELKMVRRLMVMMTILIVVCLPLAFFMILSFFDRAPKYDLRIGYLVADVSLVFVVIILFLFTEPLKVFLREIIQSRTNVS